MSKDHNALDFESKISCIQYLMLILRAEKKDLVGDVMKKEISLRLLWGRKSFEEDRVSGPDSDSAEELCTAVTETEDVPDSCIHHDHRLHPSLHLCRDSSHNRQCLRGPWLCCIPACLNGYDLVWLFNMTKAVIALHMKIHCWLPDGSTAESLSLGC